MLRRRYDEAAQKLASVVDDEALSLHRPARPGACRAIRGIAGLQLHGGKDSPSTLDGSLRPCT